MTVEVVDGRAVLPELLLTHGESRLRLSLQGAHITEYSVSGDELLWVSRSAKFAPGAAIRGGIPLCWPWFGASPDDAAWPQHGFARTAAFRLESQTSSAEGSAVVLTMEDSAPVLPWQGAASLEVEIRLSDHLWMELRTTNTCDGELRLGAGLHSYFAVSDCEAIQIPSVTGLDYLDKPSGFARRTQTDTLVVDGEVDRVYLNPPRRAELVDATASRRVMIDAWGNTDLVVWNPGATVAASMADFDDEGYRQMVCIEPAIALDSRIRLRPGECHAIGQTISVCRSGPC